MFEQWDIESVKAVFRKYFSLKQYYTLLSYLTFSPSHIIFHGSIRAGKTTIGVFLFLLHIYSFIGKKNKKQPFFFVSGASISTLNDNIVKEINHLNDLFGFGFPSYSISNNSNKIVIFGFEVSFYGAIKSDSHERLQGLSAAGWYANEVTLHNPNFIEKAFHRLDQSGAKSFWDCNPASPDHIVKAKFIDRAGSWEFFQDESKNYILDEDKEAKYNLFLNDFKSIRCMITSYYYNIYDNSFLDPSRRDSIIENALGGIFYNRDILGQWVGADGLVYPHFNPDFHTISLEDVNKLEFVDFFAGMDWGFKHYNVFTFFGVLTDGSFVLLNEEAQTEKSIDFWVEKVKSFLHIYGHFIVYCDTARPDLIDDMKNRVGERIIQGANKSVLEGIQYVSSLISSQRLKIVQDNCPLFMKEVYRYSWERGKDSVIKTYDDCMDSIRYALYSSFKKESSDPFHGRNPYKTVYRREFSATLSDNKQSPALKQNPYKVLYRRS